MQQTLLVSGTFLVLRMHWMLGPAQHWFKTASICGATGRWRSLTAEKKKMIQIWQHWEHTSPPEATVPPDAPTEQSHSWILLNAPRTVLQRCTFGNRLSFLPTVRRIFVCSTCEHSISVSATHFFFNTGTQTPAAVWRLVKLTDGSYNIVAVRVFPCDKNDSWLGSTFLWCICLRRTQMQNFHSIAEVPQRSVPSLPRCLEELRG